MQQLKNDGFEAIYFNAWENDFNNNPLVALMSELKPLIKGKVDGEKVFKSVVEKGAVLVKNVAPALMKELIRKYIVDTEAIDNAIEDTTKAATEMLEDEIEEYSNKKKTIAEFRRELEKFISERDNEKPLIFIVDELDRCRPDYAIEVLEQMKHFFSVRGIVFVLSIDKNHLASSVRGYYGSEKINTDEYLRRFIDLEYSIPKPSYKAYCGYLFEYYSFGDFFYSKERREYFSLKNDADNLLAMAELLFKKNHATLRQQEKIFGQTRLVLSLFGPGYYTFSHILFMLIYIKVMRNELYLKIDDVALTLQELSNEYVQLIPLEIRSEDSRSLIYLAALLLHFYNNAQPPEKKVPLLDNNIAQIEMVLSGLNVKSALSQSFQEISKEPNYLNIDLKYLTNKINLIESASVN